MMRLRHKLLIHAFRVLDQVMLIVTLSLLVAMISEHGDFGFLILFLDGLHYAWEMIGAVVLLLTWITIFNALVPYNTNRFTTLRTNIIGVVKATSVASFVLYLGAMLFSFSRVEGPVVPLFWVITTSLGVASRVFLRLALTVVRRSGLNQRHIVIVGTNPRAVQMARRIESRPELGCEIVGFITEQPSLEEADWPHTDRWPILDTLTNIRAYLEARPADEVILCLSVKQHFPQIHETFELCKNLGLVVRLMPDAADARALTRLQIEEFDGEYVVTFFREKLLWQLFLKRALDLAIAATLLLVLSPVLLLIALLIKVTSPGPVFFVQRRVGMNKRTFNLLKFRSMVANAEERKDEIAALNEMDGPVFKIRKDPRVTPLGRFLRKTSLDELPQLINVLLGDMSLVGPRPPLTTEVEHYALFDRKRLSIRPGITCLWQVNGRNNVPFARWMELDREYIDNWSIWLDLKILLRTIPVVLLGKGAS
ncbi:MAG: sugar transferase [Verrucomicrobiales bacterium]|nr:sugar transferase [Verrucomicrobiales bacterium]